VATKRQLADTLDPGIPAGPSESIILADENANGALAALDLLIEAEHGPDSSAFLVTPSRRVVEEALVALESYWKQMEPQRVAFSRAVLAGAHGGIVLTRDMAGAIAFANAYAPEHMEVLVAEPMAILAKLRNAGEILLGQYSAISLGNYVLGPNAVLPTGGKAKTASPLSVFDYLKRTSVAYVTKDGYPLVAEDTHRLARYEGFDAHARAVSAARTPLLKD
jgi:histidinol dehydrogenase